MQHVPTDTRRTRQARQHWHQGQTHAKAGRWAAALRAHEAASRLVPHDPIYAINHARALLARDDLEGAATEAQRAFSLDRANRVACELAVECLMQMNRCAEALQTLNSLSPQIARDAAFHGKVGLALRRMGKLREAVAAFFQSLALQPDYAQMHHNLGLCFADLDMKQEAAQCFETALLLGVGSLELAARGLACFYQRSACQWKDADANLAALSGALRKLPPDTRVATTPFAHAVLSADRGDQLLAARSYARHMEFAIEPLPPRRSDWTPAGRPLRVGYVSSDFHQHATMILMIEMLEQHDRERFEVRLYSHGPADGTQMRARTQAACAEFVDIQRLTDQQAAQRIRSDGIDLLIDLKGHTRDHRLGIMAYRSAPVQATFLGFPGTVGTHSIDYLIGDGVVTPLEHADDYSEKIAQLPFCYQPNDRQRPLPEAPTRASQGLPQDAFVLCAFNQPYKVWGEVFDSWCRLLHALPNSVLWLLEWSQQALPNLKREAALRGISPERLIGAPRVEPAAHIARFRLADLFLDTWPCNAHTTASDALWAAVPVVTLIGQTFASRVAASLINAVGTPELICEDLAQYEKTVIELAADAPRRAALRLRLERARAHSALFDSLRFTRNIEALYLRMMMRHIGGLEPDHLTAQVAA
jgi:protein O-GlcNAc transferase